MNKINNGEKFGLFTEHCPKAQPDTHFMMVEHGSTAHTGET